MKTTEAHVHTWQTSQVNACAYFEKGERKKRDWYQGMVLKCSDCSEFIFIPDNTSYSAVPVTLDGELQKEPSEQ